MKPTPLKIRFFPLFWANKGPRSSSRPARPSLKMVLQGHGSLEIEEKFFSLWKFTGGKWETSWNQWNLKQFGALEGFLINSVSAAFTGNHDQIAQRHPISGVEIVGDFPSFRVSSLVSCSEIATTIVHLDFEQVQVGITFRRCLFQKEIPLHWLKYSFISLHGGFSAWWNPIGISSLGIRSFGKV